MREEQRRLPSDFAMVAYRAMSRHDYDMALYAVLSAVVMGMCERRQRRIVVVAVVVVKVAVVMEHTALSNLLSYYRLHVDLVACVARRT